MNIKRILFWSGFIVVIGLIIWGLIVATYKKNNSTNGVAGGTPADITAADHVRGPENAPVTLIEYGDYQCPACSIYSPVVEKLITESSTTLRFVFRHFPLQQHRNAVVAGQAAEAAGKQGKYWEMHDMLYVNQDSWKNLTGSQATDVFKGYAERLKLNVATYEKDFTSAEIKAKIESDRKDGFKIGVAGTPTFFINGKSISTPPTYEAFKKLIDETASSTTQ